MRGLHSQRLPKRFPREKELSFASGQNFDVLDQQITRLNKSVLFHQDRLRENEDVLSTKQQERGQLDIAFRDLAAKGFTPTPSPVRTLVQSDVEGDEGVVGEEEAVPDASLEQDSGVSGAVRESARIVAGIAKKRRCLDSAQVLNEVVEREIAQLSSAFGKGGVRKGRYASGNARVILVTKGGCWSSEREERRMFFKTILKL